VHNKGRREVNVRPDRERKGKNGMSNRSNEIDLFEAVDLTGLSEDLLGRLIEQGKLRARRADGTVYFDRAELGGLVERQRDELRSESAE